jgi:LEM3 (ligand-effect modulator 3) family / CDC50 family
VTPTAPQWQYSIQNVTYSDSGVTVPNTIVCSLKFTIENDLGAPVLLYYRLTQFFQNHRRYVKSYDANQMKGVAVSDSSIKNGGCDPLTVDENGKPYYPCGLIANSLFNDTFNSIVATNPAGADANATAYHMVNKGISWASDRDLYKPTKYHPTAVVPPVNWRRKWGSEYPSNGSLPNLQEDEAFQVWMRTAGLPDFSKLALRNDNETMRAGQYKLDIWDGKLSKVDSEYR